jgi:signal transduction histidine kinase
MLIFILSLGFVLERRFQQYADELEVSNAKLQEYSQTLEQKVEERTHALKEAQSQLIMKASLGSLVAGVAHEVNTPIGAIYSATDVTRRCIEKIQSLLKSGQTLKEANSNTQLHKSFKILEDNNKVTTTASKRIAKIVQSLKTFARLDEAEFLKADIHEGLDSTLTLIDHEIKTRITVIKQYGEIPEIECYPNELNQVFMNVLMNAVQAIEQDGQIVIKTYLEDDKVIVKISDDGRGIPPDAMDKIFNPGFTSKGVGVGTGLGLSISYNIIQKHHGEIQVESEVGKGTTFFIILGTELKTQ